eukprot:scaffold37992_cov60-Phaeocystis_antarctica.AAC.10
MALRLMRARAMAVRAGLLDGHESFFSTRKGAGLERAPVPPAAAPADVKCDIISSRSLAISSAEDPMPTPGTVLQPCASSHEPGGGPWRRRGPCTAPSIPVAATSAATSAASSS